MKVLKTLALLTAGVGAVAVIKRVNHYQTKYVKDGKRKVESWVQLDLFNRSYTLSNRVTELD